MAELLYHTDERSSGLFGVRQLRIVDGKFIRSKAWGLYRAKSHEDARQAALKEKFYYPFFVFDGKGLIHLATADQMSYPLWIYLDQEHVLRKMVHWSEIRLNPIEGIVLTPTPE